MVVIPTNLAFYRIDCWENFENGERSWFYFMDFLRNGKDRNILIFFVCLSLTLCLCSFLFA